MARPRDPNSNASIGRRLGISRQAVRKAKAEGRIPVVITPEEAERYFDNLGGPRRPVPADSAYATERAKHEQAKARLAELELDRQLGRVVDAAAVREAGAELAELIRQGLDQLTPRLIQAIRDAPSAAQADRAARAVIQAFMGETADAAVRRCRELTTDA